MGIVEFYDAYAPFYDIIYDYEGDIPLYVEYARAAGGPVLESGVGTGRVAIPLAKAGVRVVGIDINEKMLSIARENLAKQSMDVQSRIKLVKTDMCNFWLKERFPLCIIPPYAFLELPTAENQETTLKNINQHLLPRGKLIVHMFNPDLSRPQNVIKLTDVRKAVDGLIMRFATESFDFKEQTITARWFIDSVKLDGSVRRAVLPPLKLRYVFYDEMQRMLKRTGYEVESVFGDEKKTPFKADSRLMIFVARKSGY